MAGGKAIGTVRSPGTTILLMIVTLGIYGIIWLFMTFDEVRKYRGQGWSGATFLLFTLVPCLNVVGIATYWLLPSYVGNMYAEDGQDKPITGLAGFWLFLPIAGPFIWIFKIQGALNAFWERKSGAKVAA